MQGLNIVGLRKVPHCFDLLGVWGYSIPGDNKTEIGYLTASKLTQPSCTQTSKHFLKVGKVLLERLSMTSTSSMYTMQDFWVRPDKTFSISCWNVAGELHNLNGITRNSNKPEGVAKAVFSCESGSILTCQ